jgi:hypothetical protein
MYIFGKVNQAQYDEIKAQGWEILRRPLIREVDQFCEPSYAGISEKDQDADDFFVLVWIDNDISNALTTWFNQDKSAKESYTKIELEEKRRIHADDALGTFNFHKGANPIGDDEEIEETGHWETDGPNRLICPIYYGDSTSRKQSKMGSFIVEFKPNSTEIIDKHANP